MDVNWQRVAANLIARLTGPLHLRLIFQPTMAALLGIRDGLKDATGGEPPYFWAIFTNPTHRKQLLRGGLRSVAKVLVFALVLDAIYQLIELHWFYPGEAILVALTLAFIPYLFIRGPVNRIARWWGARRMSRHAGYGALR